MRMQYLWVKKFLTKLLIHSVSTKSFVSNVVSKISLDNFDFVAYPRSLKCNSNVDYYNKLKPYCV